MRNICDFVTLLALGLSLVSAPACDNPCEATIVTVGDVSLCIPIDYETSEGDSTGGSDDDSSGDVAGTYGDQCVDGSIAGAEWGQCIDGGCPNAVETSFCVKGMLGSICMPACHDGGCPVDDNDAECPLSAGVCMDSGACRPPCLGPENACPHSGMVCDASLDGGTCLWPTTPDQPVQTCWTTVGATFAPCEDDMTCKAAGTICAQDSNGAVCIPVVSDGCAETFGACAGPGGFGKGYGAQVDACTLACDKSNGDADCIAGMVCSEHFGLCLWP